MATNASDIAPPPLRCISKKTSLVRPVSPSPAKGTTIPLTVVDRISIGIFTPAILLYSEPEDGHHRQRDFPAAVRQLEESLAEVLVEFYPLAGRLVKGAQGFPEVRCDDAGAIFTEAVAEETFEEAGGMAALPRVTGMDATGLGDRPRFSIQQHDELPILVVQVTLFRCGAITLAINWHHQVADGTSGTNFLKAWSEMAQGQPISSLPDHRRYLLAGRNPPKLPETEPPEYKVLLEVEIGESVLSTSEEVRFSFTKAEILQLKERATEGKTLGPFTSAECISAHLWRAITKARGFSRESTTNLYSVINGRKRMDGFPLAYFGNCYFLKRSVCSMGDVLEKPFGEVVAMVHDAITSCTDEYARSFVDWVEDVGPSKVGLRDGETFASHHFQPTFWTQFPIYDLDFGFGKLTYGGRNSQPVGGSSFAAVLPTAARDGSVRGIMFLQPEAAATLRDILNPENTNALDSYNVKS